MIRTRLNGLEDEESSWRKMENCSLIDFPYEESRKRHNTTRVTSSQRGRPLASRWRGSKHVPQSIGA